MYSTVAALAVIGWSCPSGTWTATRSALLLRGHGMAWHGYMAEMDVPTGRRSVTDRCSLRAEGGLTQSPGTRHLALTGGRPAGRNGSRVAGGGSVRRSMDSYRGLASQPGISLELDSVKATALVRMVFNKRKASGFVSMIICSFFAAHSMSRALASCNCG